MNIFDIIQLMAGCCFSYSYVPQITRILRYKSAKDVSLGMCSLIASGNILFEIYIIYLIMTVNKGVTMLITNTIAMILAVSTAFLILKYRK